MRRWIPVVLFAALGQACGSVRTSTAPGPANRTAVNALRASIDSLTTAPEFSNAHWGVLIVDPESGDTLYAHNAGKLFMPASNMKILTTSTALARLGPDYRYRTIVATEDSVRDGTIGDLLVIGRGDPSVSDHMMKDAMLPLRAMADSLFARGVRRIDGGVRAVGDAFPGEHLGYGWSYDDFEDSYSAPIDELLFNEGFSELHVHAGANPGDPVRVETRPARTFPVVQVAATTVARSSTDTTRPPDAGLVVTKDSTNWTVLLSGQIAVNDSAVIEVTHHDPDDAYVAALREAIRDRGITIADGSVATDPTKPTDTLFAYQSPTLAEILPPLLKPSQNQLAEMLFRTLALEANGAGRADSARAIVGRQIAEWGANVPAEAVIRDGSGLSRYDYVSPRTLVKILAAVRTNPAFKVYYDALPIAGVDGTLRNRMKDTPAQGNVHAKTGTVALARSLSGYVTTADGHMLIFSFLCNNYTVPTREVDRVQDAIGARLAALRLR